MTTRTTPPSSQGYRFPDSKVVRYIETLRKIQFSGQLIWIAPGDEKKWSFYLYSGRIFYATGGTHPVRRWARNLATYCPQIQPNITQLQQDLRKISPADLMFGWEYYLFCLWVEKQKLTQAQVSQTIQSILSEVLFDVSQAQGLTCQVKKIELKPELLVSVDEKKAIAAVELLWKNLWKYNIDVNFLDQAPIIKYPERLQELASTETYKTLTQLLDGEKTLCDLAMQVRLDVVQVSRSLLPYIQSGLVELVSTPDLPNPVYPGVSKKVSEPTGSDRPLIACVDDSLIACWTMEKILTAAGYRFISINEGLKAIITLLSYKPDLIFLDVFMPDTNGYEICKNLRKAPSFQNTPIVFLTGLNGVVDQVRARLAGASDFLSKPIDSGRVLSVTSKHLPQGAIIPRN